MRARDSRQAFDTLATAVGVSCGLVATIAVAVIPTLEMARRDRIWLDEMVINQGLEAYRVRIGHYPDSMSAVVAEGIFTKVPFDPWNEEYFYELKDGRPIVVSPGQLRADAALASAAQPPDEIVDVFGIDVPRADSHEVLK